MVEVMAAVRRFWSGGRRRFIAKTLATGSLLLVGGLVTSEVLEKLSVVLKWLIGAGAAIAFLVAVLVWSDESSSSKEDE